MMAIDLPKGLGYAGTAIGGAEHNQFLSMVGRGGAGYCGTIDAGKVSIVPSETRTIEVGAGPVYGNAIRDEIPTGVRIQLPEEMAGSRYYLIVRRAIWKTTDASRIDYIPGDDTRTIPTHLADPGVEADTPLALVRITKGSPQPTEIVDLRLIAEEPGTYTIFDTMALALAMRPGVVCYHATTGVTYRCVYQNGALAWLQSGGVAPHVMVSRFSPYSGTLQAPLSMPLYGGITVYSTGEADQYMVGVKGTNMNNLAVTDPGRIEIRKSGLYALGGSVDANPSTGTYMQFELSILGLPSGQATAVDARYVQSGWCQISVTDTRYLTAGSVVRGYVSQSAGTQQMRRWWLWATRLGD